MSVQLDPSELGFRRPFTHEVSQLLRLQNPSDDPMAFKVKTTAPKQYCVRPNSGKIEPGSAVEVQVLLQAMREDPPPDARCRDKFLVQTVAISRDSDASNIPAIWQNIEKVSKGSIQERKIRVVFLPADGNSTASSHHNINGAHLSDEAPPAYGSPTSSFGSPAPDAPTQVNRSTTSHTVAKTQGHLATQDAAIPKGQSGVETDADVVTSPIPPSEDDLRAQLANAKATISKLTQQAEEQSLRQRKSDAANQDSKEHNSTGTPGVGIQQQPADGVPVQIVAALCLLSFLLAYFFF